MDDIKNILNRHKEMIADLEQNGIDTITKIAELIVTVFKNNGCLYICGNGGSAADAQHIAAELTGRFEHDRPALPAIALTTDTSLLTSVANDYSFENIFARQVQGLVKDGDILLAISTSGNSPNVVAAAVEAKNKNAHVIAFTGKQKSKLQEIADICFCAEDKLAARSQEIHLIAYHIICGLVEEKFL